MPVKRPEKRKSKRRRVKTVVQFIGPDDKKRLGVVADVSKEGVFIETEYLPPVGSPVKLIFILRDGRKISINGRVVRAKGAFHGEKDINKLLGGWETGSNIKKEPSLGVEIVKGIGVKLDSEASQPISGSGLSLIEELILSQGKSL